MGTQLDSGKLSDVNRTFRAVFLKELGTPARWSDEISVRVPMERGTVVVKWAARTAGVNEWLDERIKSKLRAFSFPLEAKKWANGMLVDGADLEDDDSALGLYRPQIAELADDFKEHRHQLIIDLLNAGFAGTKGLTYDGQFLIDSDHSDGGAVQSNLFSGALSATTFRAARTQMTRIRRPNGMLANVYPTHLVYPPELQGAVEDIFLVDRLSNGATNPNYKVVTPIVEPRLSSTTAWFLLDNSKPIKAFMFGDRRAVMLRAKINPNDPGPYDRDLYEWGADGRYNATYMFWHVIGGSPGT